MENIKLFGLIFNLLNLSLYILISIAAIFNCFYGGFANFLLNIYVIGLCGLLFFSEIYLTQVAQEYFKFLSKYSGRGILYIFLGAVSFARIGEDSGSFQKGVGILTLIIGVLYVIATFIPTLPDLNGMTVNIGRGGVEVVERSVAGPVALPADEESGRVTSGGQVGVGSSNGGYGAL